MRSAEYARDCLLRQLINRRSRRQRLQKNEQAGITPGLFGK
jgi:hypothetical protein